jgi:hypothetical protein
MLIRRRAKGKELTGKTFPDHFGGRTILFLRALIHAFFTTGGFFLNTGGRRQKNKRGSY